MNERKFISENIKRLLLKENIKDKVKRAGFGGIDIQRTPMGTRVTLVVERPGLVIGKKGSAIKDLTDIIEKDFKFDNPQVEVNEERKPNLNAQIMAFKLAEALERGWHFRRAGHSTVQRIMDAGARGCQVVISGKLTGERHRSEKFTAGNIKYCGDTARIWMDIGYAVAMTKPGIMGVIVKIMNPESKLPDDISILTPKTPEQLAEEQKMIEEEKRRIEKRRMMEEERRKSRRRRVRKESKVLKKLKKEIKDKGLEEEIDVDEVEETVMDVIEKVEEKEVVSEEDEHIIKPKGGGRS